MRKLIYGVGDRCGLPTQIEDVRVRSYNVWANMLRRCYSNPTPAYEDVTVCSAWLKYRNFKAWYNENYVEGYQLDKDLTDSRIYAPYSCNFVPPEVNGILIRPDFRGTRPHGKGFKAQLSVNGIHRHVGTYPTEEAAHQAYKLAKGTYISLLCVRYPDFAIKLTKWGIEHEFIRCNRFTNTKRA